VAELLFYHLQRRPLEAVLPFLLQKTLERGWRAIVQGRTTERLQALDDHLWTYDEEGFLPHAMDGEPGTAQEPVLLTTGAANPNGAAVRFLIEQAAMPDDLSPYARIVVMFDGEDPEALAAAREEWRKARANGNEATYWQQDDRGRWEKKA